jgi:hypothetical protein
MRSIGSFLESARAWTHARVSWLRLLLVSCNPVSPAPGQNMSTSDFSPKIQASEVGRTNAGPTLISVQKSTFRGGDCFRNRL